MTDGEGAEIAGGDPQTAFDLTGFEIVRGPFFQSTDDIAVSVTVNALMFTRTAVVKLGKTDTVELLFDPVRKMLAVRPVAEDNKHSIQWASTMDGRRNVRMVCGTAFLPLIFDMMGWKQECR